MLVDACLWNSDNLDTRYEDDTITKNSNYSVTVSFLSCWLFILIL